MEQLSITTEQYKTAIEATLTNYQIRILKSLYSFPDSTATAIEIAEQLNPFNPANIIAGGTIGKIGRRISEFLSLDLPFYNDGKGDKRAYFLVVGPYFDEGPNGERAGWEMNEALMQALEELGHVPIKAVVS